MLDSKALTKMQSIILITIIVIATVGGGVAYFLLTGEDQPSIKIGLLGNFGFAVGAGPEAEPKGAFWQGVALAAEQINAEGGILGKQVEVFVEDIGNGIDMEEVSIAITRLITLQKVDFIIGTTWGQSALVCQDILSVHKRIMLDLLAPEDYVTQRIIDEYDKYKYYFRIGLNQTTINDALPPSIAGLREYTGFNKVGYLAADVSAFKGMVDGLNTILPDDYDFQIVYEGKFMPGVDITFSSYFAAAEAAGAEILITLTTGQAGIQIVKEWNDRQSPMVLWGINAYAAGPGFWEGTDGKCLYESFLGDAIVGKYPLTSKTLPFLNDYVDRWGEEPYGHAVDAYNVLRFILVDAIIRAGTIETEAVIKALEETSIETSSSINFSFTPSHDHLVTDLWDVEEVGIFIFQYQNEGELVPVYPREIMEQKGKSYIFPDWSGPWDNIG